MPLRCHVLCIALAAGLTAERALAQDNEPRYHDGIVAEVNGDPITGHEVEVFSRLSLRYRDLKKRGVGAPQLVTEQRLFRDDQLKTLIEERVLIQEAAKEKLQLSKDDERRIDREVERQALQHGGVEGLKRTLESIGVPYDYFLERKRANMLIGKLLLKNVSREIFVPPEQIRRYYRDHPEKFDRSGRVVIRQILITNDLGDASRVPQSVEPMRAGWDRNRALELATKLRDKAVKGGDFAAIAREWSMDNDQEHKGGLYIFNGGSVDLIDPVGPRANELKPGEVSEPLVSRVGVHLVQMVERRPRGTLPLHEVQREIENRLRSEAWQERLAAWIKRLSDDAEIKKYVAPD
jgi:parvulin-like peptidyl-prolyl isomerase